MRLWHLLAMVLFLACVLAIGRDDVGRVAMIVFLTGLIECAVGTSALLMLFRTLGGLGEARGLVGHVEAAAATALVLAVSTLVMNAVLWVGVWLVQHAVT